VEKSEEEMTDRMKSLQGEMKEIKAVLASFFKVETIEGEMHVAKYEDKKHLEEEIVALT
jgi:hypothetical protein